MNIATMHIGIDVEMQQLNSAVFNKLQHEEKDYILNDVIENLIRSAINKDDNTVSTIVSYQDIRQYYSILEPFIRTVELAKSYSTGDIYTYGLLPSDISIAAIITGVLWKDVKYKVQVAGTTNLTAFGGTSPPVVDDIFTCTLSNNSGTPATTIAGDSYRILDPADTSWTTAGAPDSEVGTVWEATGAAAGGTEPSTLEALAEAPTWLNNTKLIPVYNPGYNNILAVFATIDCGENIASGALELNKQYRVVVKGTTDFSSHGGYNADLEVGVIFTCNSALATITWTGQTELVEVKRMGCRLIKMQDVDNFMQHSFGSTRTSPVAVIADGKVRVYHNNEFDIHQVHINYIRKPLEVNYSESVDSDIHSSLHSFIVKLAARQALGISGAKEYQSLVMESEQDKEAINK